MSSLPDDFDWITYIYFYDDLKNMSYTDVYYHYLGYGTKENRLYKYSQTYSYYLITEKHEYVYHS